MKKFILIVIVIHLSLNLFGQEEQDTLLLQKKLSFGYVDYLKYMFEERSALSSCFMYNPIVYFPNSPLIKGMGAGWKMRVMLFPFILDWTQNINEFKVKNIYQIPQYQSGKYNLTQLDFNISISVCPLPRISRLSEFIVPYIGLGIGANSLDFTSNPASINSFIDLSPWQWKVGCNFYLDKCPFYVIVEYRETMNRNKMRNVGCVNIGLSFDVLKNLPDQYRRISKRGDKRVRPQIPNIVK